MGHGLGAVYGSERLPASHAAANGTGRLVPSSMTRGPAVLWSAGRLAYRPEVYAGCLPDPSLTGRLTPTPCACIPSPGAPPTHGGVCCTDAPCSRGTMLDLCYSETCIGPMGAENNWDDCGLDDTCGEL